MDKEISKAEAILEEMDEQIRILQSARKAVSYETLKTKYSESWKKLTERKRKNRQEKTGYGI